MILLLVHGPVSLFVFNRQIAYARRLRNRCSKLYRALLSIT